MDFKNYLRGSIREHGDPIVTDPKLRPHKGLLLVDYPVILLQKRNNNNCAVPRELIRSTVAKMLRTLQRFQFTADVDVIVSASIFNCVKSVRIRNYSGPYIPAE